MAVISTLQLSVSRSCFFHLNDVNQADGRDLAWLVELFWSALAPSGGVSSKMLPCYCNGKDVREGIVDL